MVDYTFFMHDDGRPATAWQDSFSQLRASGRLDGGSAIGDGICVGKSGSSKPIASPRTGYLRVRAESVDDARRLLEGDPVYENGGTVEIRVLPRDRG